ncbi:MAG: NAD-dependent epimerase/dehydratase family protein [Steroidobacteraceae bacterium]
MNTPDAAAEPIRRPVVVLGAGGYIGRQVVAALAASSWAVPVAVGRRIQNSVFDVGVRRVAADATNEAVLEPLLADAVGVVSCIAGDAGDIVRGGQALLNVAARMDSAPRIVYLSSIAAYGAGTGIVDEDSPLRGDLGDYSASKALVDQMAAVYPFVVRLRPGIVYGPGSPWWTDRIGRLLVARRLGDLGAAGEGRCNLVHIDDVVAAILKALQLPEATNAAFNLGSPVVPTWNEYFARYAQALGAAPVRRIGRAQLAIELNLAGPLLKIREKLTGSEAVPAIRPWLTTLCRHAIQMRVERAQSVLGMQWKPLGEGIGQCAEWFRSVCRL